MNANAARLSVLQVARGYARWYRWRRANRPEVRHQREKPLATGSAVVLNALTTLQREGIAQFKIGALTGGNALFKNIRAEYDAVIDKHRSDIEEHLAAMRDGSSSAYKSYLLGFTPNGNKRGYNEAIIRFALHPEVLAIANAFQGMYTQLYGCVYWYTLASNGREPTASQLWHRDFEDTSVLKAFVYIDDVDEGTGPFQYVSGSHRGALRWTDPKATRDGEGALRVSDPDMVTWVPRERWKSLTGEKGTVILAATTGYHKGGYGTRRDRRMLYVGYRSARTGKKGWPSGVTGMPPDLHPAIRFAGYADSLN